MGCAIGTRASSPQTGELSLQGDNTRLRIIIDRRDSITPDEANQILADQEMCYLTIERLPDALADYVDSDNPHNPGVATTLARELLESAEVNIAGMSRAGPFKVVLQLTDDGKETIRGALADRESGNLRFVHHVRRHEKNSGLAAKTRRAAGTPVRVRDGGPSPLALR